MKRVLSMLLVALLLPCSALCEERKISTQGEAIAFAKTLWTNECLSWDTGGLYWTAEIDAERNRIYVEGVGENPNDALRVFANLEGHVDYIHNGFSRYLDAIVGDPDGIEKNDALAEDVAKYLLAFVDSMNPGCADRIEAFVLPQASSYGERRFLSLSGLVLGQNGEPDTYTLFIVQLEPERKVVLFSEGIPVDDTEGVG